MTAATTSSPATRDDLASLEAGLDALEAHDVASTPFWRRALAATWPPTVFFALLLVVWELAYRAELKPTYALPSPADVGLQLREWFGDGTLLEAIGTSVERGGLGFVVAVAIGTPLGLLLAEWALLRLQALAKERAPAQPAPDLATPSSMIAPYLKPPGKKKPKPRGRPAGHAGARRAAPVRIDRRVEHKLKHCPDCGVRDKVDFEPMEET